MTGNKKIPGKFRSTFVARHYLTDNFIVPGIPGFFSLNRVYLFHTTRDIEINSWIISINTKIYFQRKIESTDFKITFSLKLDTKSVSVNNYALCNNILVNIIASKFETIFFVIRPRNSPSVSRVNVEPKLPPICCHLVNGRDSYSILHIVKLSIF